MYLSTSSNIHQSYRQQSYFFSLQQSIASCSQAGFSHIDLSWHSYAQEGQPLALDTWQEFVHDVGAVLVQSGCIANQSHTLFYNHQEIERRPFHERMVERCLLANDMLGISATVMHILRIKDLLCDDPKVGMQKNIAYFCELAELLEKRNIKTRIAIENGLTGFFHRADELLELLEHVGHPQFGLCWDTGHANITGQNQEESILLMKDALLCTHLNDNNAKADQHLLPYFGTVDFPRVMQALYTIKFRGVCTFESSGSTQYAPPSLRPSLLSLAVEIGRHLQMERR